MPNTEQIGDIVNKIISTCTFPSPSELEDHTCHICHTESLGPDGSERPTKFRCGHILGMSCIMKWAFTELEAGSTDLQCPFCRASFFAVPAMRDTSRRYEALDNLRMWSSHLANWTPEGPEGIMNNRSYICRIRRAEELWDIFCQSMLDFLDRETSNTGWTPSEAIELFICSSTPPMMQYLSWGTVYNFAYAYMKQGWRPTFDTELFITENFWQPYEELLAHLRMMDADDLEWRVFQAFQAPNFQLMEFRNRLEQCRIKLAQRARGAESII
ncbi:MAG: hypothetical protein Q9182_006229 [Xanthomendoza sp. 2 TL-2023]